MGPGTCSCCVSHWRHLEVTERHTMKDFAHQMRWLVDTAYPETKKIRVVLET